LESSISVPVFSSKFHWCFAASANLISEEPISIKISLTHCESHEITALIIPSFILTNFHIVLFGSQVIKVMVSIGVASLLFRSQHIWNFFIFCCCVFWIFRWCCWRSKSKVWLFASVSTSVNSDFSMSMLVFFCVKSLS
jgi:hypothetical protein